jgi:hypothetical protein
MLEADLPEAYDYAAPAFPPHLNAFDALFQMYHIQVKGGPVAVVVVVPGPAPPASSMLGQALLVTSVSRSTHTAAHPPPPSRLRPPWTPWARPLPR